MPNKKVIPTTKTCPICETNFLVGGRGRPPRKTVYCSRKCMGKATYSHLPLEKGTHTPRPKKNKDTLHNEGWLRNKYIDEELSTTQIGILLGCSVPSVRWALNKFSIPIRTISEARIGRPNTTIWTNDMRGAMTAKQIDAWKIRPHENFARRGENYHPDPRVSRVRHVRSQRRGITGNDYDRMVEVQNGLCYICHQPETKINKNGTAFTLSVDHDHKTEKIRKLLCNACNAALGLIKDDVETLKSMISYLGEHQLE